MNILHKNPEGLEIVADVVQDTGNTDYVLDGVVYENAPIKVVLVGGSSDLALLGEYTPGTVAYTAGFGSMWQKAPDGTWESM